MYFFRSFVKELSSDLIKRKKIDVSSDPKGKSNPSVSDFVLVGTN